MTPRIPISSTGEFLIFTVKSFLRHECNQSAAALTYATLFAFVPLITVIYTILSFFPSMAGAPDLVSGFILSHLVPNSGQEVLSLLNTFTAQSSELTIVGIIILLFTAIMMLRKIEWTFNKIWEVDDSRKGIKTLVLYWSVLSLGTLLLGSGLVISSYLTSMKVFESLSGILYFPLEILTTLPFISTTIAFSLLYIAVPNCYIPSLPAIAGAVIAALLFEAAKKLFAWFAVSFSTYQVIYGAFAAIPLFILWIYISWNIVLLGVEFVKSLVVFKPANFKTTQHPLLELLQIIQYCWENQQQGKTVSKENMNEFLYTLPDADWGELRHILLHNKILQRTEYGDFEVLADLNTLSLRDLVYMTPWNLNDFHSLININSQQEWENSLIQKWRNIESTLSNELDISVNTLLEIPTKSEPAPEPINS